MGMTKLAEQPAHVLLSLYESGQASPVETTREMLKRIEQLNPSLNAFCLVDEQKAMASAHESEARWLAWRKHRLAGPGSVQRPGALEGIPVSIKDLVLTKDWPTLRGSKTVDPQQAWTIDAPVTARLREAGAILFGKTTTPEFGCKGETNSPLTGITRNPWRLDKTTGGSSGGAAAAVAAGLGPLGVGTDGAGSVRIPAAFCGNVGFKPSFGRIPAYPLSPFGSVAHLGPHSMSVVDCALAMNVMKQADARDWTALPPDASDYTIGLNDGIAGLRVAYSPRLGYVKQLDPEIELAVKETAIALESLGAVVEAVDPGIEDSLDISFGLWVAGAANLWRGLSDGQRQVTDPDFRSEAALGLEISLAQIHDFNQRRGVLGSTLRQFMTRFDLILTPSTAVCAFDIRQAGSAPSYDAQTMLGWTPYSFPFNLSQQPAISFPWCLNHQGLPIGVQLVGPMFGDALVLRAARALESIRSVQRPDVSVAH
ncbi:MAG: amidase [Betaproteobacteria bacterium]|nr:amidase [Betaproteobacteria bacterium]